MAAKTATATTTRQPSDDEIASLGCWPGTPANKFVTRREFTYHGQAVPKGVEIIVPDARIARRLVKARLLQNPMEVD